MSFVPAALVCAMISKSPSNREHVEFDNACELGRRWFERPLPKLLNLVDGQPAELQTAISSAVQLLSQSTAPLICGLDHLTTQAQQNAWRLADRLGATIDSTMTNAGRASQFALQRIGNVTATLGEVASRSDLVVYWYCDPESTHPRHLARYGKPDDGKNRTVVVVDDHQSATARAGRRVYRIASRRGGRGNSHDPRFVAWCPNGRASRSGSDRAAELTIGRILSPA